MNIAPKPKTRKTVSFTVDIENYEVFKRLTKLFGSKQSAEIDNLIGHYITISQTQISLIDEAVKKGDEVDSYTYGIYQKAKEILNDK